MKQNLQIVLDYLKQQSISAQAAEGVSAEQLGSACSIHRSNVSRLLNELVRTGEAEKLSGWPVRYRLKVTTNARDDASGFSQLVGQTLSLKNSIQLAKAAVLYPQKRLESVIFGPPGSGKSQFAMAMIDFAKSQGVIPNKAPLVQFDCKDFLEDEEALWEILKEIFEKERGRRVIFLIEHLEALVSGVMKKLLEVLFTEDTSSQSTILCTCNSGNHSYAARLSDVFAICIHLPGYGGKGLPERLQLIEHFFSIESACIGKELHINAELLHCLIMYDCAGNLKQLKRDIRLGTASAYARELGNESGRISVTVSDFPDHVRKGILNYRLYRNELQGLVPEQYKYIIVGGNRSEAMQREISNDETGQDSIYETISNKAQQLRQRGMTNDDVAMIINADIDVQFKNYQGTLSHQISNIEELAKIVNVKLIHTVSDFLSQVSQKCNRVFSETILYGLCLHLHATILKLGDKSPMRSSKVVEIIERYPVEYSLAVNFVTEIEERYQVKLPIDEVVFITMFLCEGFYEDSYAARPVVLVLMHGPSTATSLSETVNVFLKETIAYGFDLPLDVPPSEIYEPLRQKMLEVDRGKGLVVIYDMGSLRTMSEMIAAEEGIEIKLVEAPISLMAIDYARKCLMSGSLHELTDAIAFHHIPGETLRPAEQSTLAGKAVITLCMSGQGGAVQIKEYIEQALGDKAVYVKALAVGNEAEMLREVNQIRKDYEICSVVGTFRPNVHPPIPFIGVSTLFETQKSKLKKLLRLHHEDYLNNDRFYEYLHSSLFELEVNDLRKTLPGMINRLELLIDEDFTQDQCIGLFMHIACSINRYCAKVEPIKNDNTNWIAKQYPELFEQIRKEMHVLEKRFRIRFEDDEIATILSYIKLI